MSEPNIENALQNFEKSNLRSLISHLLVQLSLEDEKIISLENRGSDLEVRVNECDVYSSKKAPRLIRILNNWISRYVTISDDFLAILPIHRISSLAIFWVSGKITTIPPAIIVKFLYFN